MEVVNEVVPSSQEQLEAMGQPGPDGPIFMVNLVKFKDKAEYADGRSNSLTGMEAYALYGVEVAKIVASLGGEVVFAGDVTFLSLGQVEELWDQVSIVKYPNRAAMVSMILSEEYQAIHHHREAGLAGQLNIETVGRQFG